MKNFQNCLGYFHHSDLTELVRRTIPSRQQFKKGKMDSDRASYSLLLQHAVQQLQRYQREGPNGVKDPIFIDMELISPLCDELVALANRQCLEKGQIIKLVVTFYKQSLLLTHVASQEAVKQSLIDYSHNMESHRKAAENQVSILKKQLFLIKKESEEKWRTFYMIVKDNRVLRRQKGKLLRALQQERVKICSLHRQMLEIAKQNQKNRLLLNYSHNQKAFSEYLTHSQAVNKLDNFIKQYPRRAKKILRNQLDRLQACENMALDDKIMYILKTAKQAEEILDEYEDLADTNERTNKLIFNISTQTDPFDIGIDSHPQKNQVSKNKNPHMHTQTQKRRLRIYSKQWEHFSSNFRVVESSINKRRKALKTNAREDLNVIDAVRHFKDNTIDRKVCSIKIKCKGIHKQQELHSNLYNISLYFEPEVKDFPYLHTNYRLQMDIKRSKDISRRQYERRSSRHSIVYTGSQADSQQKIDTNKIIEQISSSVQLPKEEFKRSIKAGKKSKRTSQFSQDQEKKSLKPDSKRKSQKYKINKSKGKTKDYGIKVDLSQGSLKQQNKIANLSSESLGQHSLQRRRSSRASINKHRESIKDLIGLYPSKMSSLASSKDELNSLSTLNDNSVESTLKLPIQSTSKMRKSGFAMYKKLQTLPNQVPEESSPESKNSEKKKQTNFDIPAISKQKLKPKPPAVVRKSTMKTQPTARVLPPAKVGYKIRAEKQSQIFADLSNLQVTVNLPTQLKSNTSTKVINIFAPQCSRLLDKISKLVLLRRKEISVSAPVFEQFLITFLASHYGSRKFVLNTKFCKKKGGQHPLSHIYDYLLDHTAPSDFLQHCFRLFARLLAFTGSDHPYIDSSRSQDIQIQLLLLHFSHKKCQQILAFSLRESNVSLSLSSVYLRTVKQIKHALQNSQIYQFLVRLLPKSQKKINFQELRQLMYLFSNDKQYLHQLISLKKLCNPDISILNLCFYAIKDEWRPLLNIKDYISEQLNAYMQNSNTLDSLHSSEDQQEVISDLSKAQFPWLSAVLQSKIKEEEDSLLFQTTAAVLNRKILMQRGIPISSYLIQLQQQFISLSIKKEAGF